MSDQTTINYQDEIISDLRIELSASQAREAELREKLELLKAAYEESVRLQDASFRRAEAAEARIKASQGQEPEVQVKLCASCGFRQNCPTRDGDGGLCDDYVAQPKEPKQ